MKPHNSTVRKTRGRPQFNRPENPGQTTKAVIGLSVEYAGQQLIVFTAGDYVQIFYRHHLVHAFTIDRTRSYQAIRPRGGPRRTLPS